MGKLKKASVTYTAPDGDSKVVEMGGVTYFDGIATDAIGTEEHLKKLEGNPHFKVGAIADYTPPAEKPKAKAEPEHHETANHSKK